jgi:hypothetical protein
MRKPKWVIGLSEIPDEAAYGADSVAWGLSKHFGKCTTSGKTPFLPERRNNLPVEAFVGYLFAQERLLSHVLFIALMIIMLVVLIDGLQRVTSNPPPAMAEKQELYHQNLEMTDKIAPNQGALFSHLLPHFSLYPY